VRVVTYSPTLLDDVYCSALLQYFLFIGQFVKKFNRVRSV